MNYKLIDPFCCHVFSTKDVEQTWILLSLTSYIYVLDKLFSINIH